MVAVELLITFHIVSYNTFREIVHLKDVQNLKKSSIQ